MTTVVTRRGFAGAGAAILAACFTRPAPVRAQGLTVVRGIGEQVLKFTEFAPPTARTVLLRADLSDAQGTLLIGPADRPDSGIRFFNGQTNSLAIHGDLVSIAPTPADSQWALEVLGWTDS